MLYMSFYQRYGLSSDEDNF